MKTEIAIVLLVTAAFVAGCADEKPAPVLVDTLITGGLVFDGSGGEAVDADVALHNGKIVFVGDAAERVFEPRHVIDATGKWVVPGFIDMHSHAELDEDYGRDAAPYLHQGITTVVLGVDGSGTFNVAERLAAWEREGIGVNGLLYVGHGAIRREVLGMAERDPDPAELEAMKELVRKGMGEGAFGFSTGLFYVPGSYSGTDEVVALAKAAAEFENAIYDTHDRDLGAAYQGIGYDASVSEGIRITEESGLRGIFSHYNLQGAHNYGRAEAGAKYINEARARGVDIWAAHHPYTATQSSLRAYTMPGWAAAGGMEAMVARFDDPEQSTAIKAATLEMLEIRGGAEKILLVDERPELNGKTLAEYAEENELEVADAVQQILRIDNAAVMNLELYDHNNTRRLAQEPWMMTCTDGRTPHPDQGISHPRTFGAFPMKKRLFVDEEPVINAAFAIRSFSGLAADFLRLEDRGYIREGQVADIAVLDPERWVDKATFEQPKQLSEGVEHVFVGGVPAISDGELTGSLAGVALRR